MPITVIVVRPSVNVTATMSLNSPTPASLAIDAISTRRAANASL